MRIVIFSEKEWLAVGTILVNLEDMEIEGDSIYERFEIAPEVVKSADKALDDAVHFDKEKCDERDNS